MSRLRSTNLLSANRRRSACLASGFRIAQFNKSRQIDPTYTTSGSIMWSIIEQSIGLDCACLTTLRPLLWSKSRRTQDDPTPYYNRRFTTIGSSGRRRASRLSQSQPKSVQHNLGEDSESVVELALGSKQEGMTSIYHEEVNSEEGIGMHDMPRDPPTLAILKTQEVRQHSMSLE